MTAILDSWQLILPLILGAAAVWWLLPTSAAARPKIVAAFLGIAAFAILAGRLSPAMDANVSRFITALFGLSAVTAAVLMVTNRNPVYAALWFAVVTLSVCGLFLMQSAPFLAAATIIVYAGAIIVTFLFVIALAQQAGATVYDQRARQPFMATVAGFVLLGGMLFALSKGLPLEPGRAPELRIAARKAAVAQDVPDDEAVVPEGIVIRQPEQVGTLRGLGQLMFTHYLYSIEIAGTLLLIATIGAIAIAPRRSHGTL
ncbi:NADH-quinone oxidoreductase subunit J [Caulifigura coniformis]|uniref:NADH-quinone oxidoreductase subunit J n=1 Tax=Caulifigura coniformis TaxID=2527983 RepID=A0A517SIM0_9PLAN|nr:NADH-quinone oxidoreductase subunit J [Caulifigura coniformis]QDT55965.1 NADH-quinone oxidoreductase subunit J [Caulifigura coniformis]